MRSWGYSSLLMAHDCFFLVPFSLHPFPAFLDPPPRRAVRECLVEQNICHFLRTFGMDAAFSMHRCMDAAFSFVCARCMVAHGKPQ